MKLNMGTTDRSIRLVVVAIIAALYFTGQITGTVAVVLGVVAVVFVVTSLVGFCPAYVPFGISTRRTERPMPPRAGTAV
jgi:hypothetical protein